MILELESAISGRRASSSPPAKLGFGVEVWAPAISITGLRRKAGGGRLARRWWWTRGGEVGGGAAASRAVMDIRAELG